MVCQEFEPYLEQFNIYTLRINMVQGVPILKKYTGYQNQLLLSEKVFKKSYFNPRYSYAATPHPFLLHGAIQFFHPRLCNTLSPDENHPAACKQAINNLLQHTCRQPSAVILSEIG